MGKIPTISVLIPIYNAEKYLGRCLDSLQRQIWTDFEIVAVDDGSQDGSVRICEKYAQADHRIRLIRQTNRGVSAARNTCLRESRGEYLTFVDSDDWVEPQYLESLLSTCQKYQVPLSACNHWIEGEKKKRVCFSGQPTCVFSARQACENVLYHRPPDVSPWGKLYRRQVLAQICYPEGKYYEDTYCIADILLQAEKMVYLDQPLYHYCLHKESISRGQFQSSKLQFLEAVEHMTHMVETRFPELKRGVDRRKVHAALSVRRYLVDCPDREKTVRRKLEQEICRQAGGVLRDPQAPLRDKVGICSVLAGPKAYDLLWKVYKRHLRPD